LTALLLHASRLGGAERTVLTLALSFTVAVVGGFVLNLTPWGLERTSWTLLLGGLTFIAAATAIVQRLLCKYRGGCCASRLGVSTGVPSVAGFVGLLLSLVGVGTVVGTVAMNHSSASAHLGAAFTQLWLLPAPDEGPGEAVRVGVRNYEGTRARYILVVTASERLLFQWSDVDLEAGAAWERALAVPPDSEAPRIEAWLYRAEAPNQVYRRVFVARSALASAATQTPSTEP
jgi:hypothetical protein